MYKRQIAFCFLLFACGEDSPTTAPQPPAVSNITLSVADAIAFEEAGESELRFQVTASEILTEPISVDFETVANTAEGGIDFQQTTGQVTIEAGERSATIPITILVDDLNEVDESFQLNVRTTSSNASLANTVATGVIGDNDDPVLAEDGYSTAQSFAGYSLSWEDDFEGDQLDEESYTFEMGDGCPDICGWGNRELQIYRGAPENTNLVDGSLVITAQQNGNEFNSSRIITQGKRAVSYTHLTLPTKA